MRIRNTALLGALAAAVAAAVALYGGDPGARAQTGKEESRVKRHFKIERPANLSPAEALTIYDNIGETMADAYALSREIAAERFRKWRRYNTAPYRSATHGNRYVNNYANPRAAGYGGLKPGEPMPPGTIVAKDSFTVSANGDVYGGPLFVMEKLGAGVSPRTGGWRYVMIMPDGSYFGDSTGENARRVEFCGGCHRTAKQDRLFFIPEPYRRRFLGGEATGN